MVGMLVGLVQNVVRCHHVVNNVGFGNLLGAKLRGGGQIEAVVVAQMIVGGNRQRLDSRVDQKVNQRRLHLGLSRLQEAKKLRKIFKQA
jgi:hypothetical protein